MKKDLKKFLLASAFLGIAMGIDSAIFNNFLNDTFHITVSQRTLMEFPREFPGFLVVFVSGFLFFLGDVRIAAIANILAAAGLMGLGYLSGEFGFMVAWMTLFSMGQHLYMPVSSTIGMNLAEEGQLGKVLGKINGTNTATFLVTSLVIAGVFKWFTIDYKIAFTLQAMAYIASAITIFSMTPHKMVNKGFNMIVRKEYKLYYILCVVFGARKQIFITFGPWVLIKVFHQGVSTFAILGFVIAAIGIFAKPYIGHLIDKLGEKFVLASEAILLILICAGYGLAVWIFGNTATALYIVLGCFVVDQILVAAGMARATYLKKIAIKDEDVSPTLSLGISVDHIVSMIIPWFGGLLWDFAGYEWVFLCGAIIACVNLVLTRFIQVPDRKATGSKIA